MAAFEVIYIPLASPTHHSINKEELFSLTYTKDDASTFPIPSGIFSWATSTTLLVNSTSESDVGTYLIKVYSNETDESLRKPLPSFTLTITSKAPSLRPSRHLASITDHTMPHNTNYAFDLISNYFPSYIGLSFVTTASYIKDGGSSVAIPGGIFISFTNFAFTASSTSIQDVGVYSITLTAIKSAFMTETSSFILRVTNTAPIVS
jgi:hypothetical protein